MTTGMNTLAKSRKIRADLRLRVAAIMDRMPREERMARSTLAQRHLLALPEYAAAQRVMLYVSLPDEVHTRPLIHAAIVAGKLVYVPKVDHKVRPLKICRLRDLGQLRPGALNIPEPEATETVQPAQLDFVLVPGRVFDCHGNRIGRGGGYYDRFLANPALRAVRVGLAFDCQFCDGIPVHLGDYPLRFIVTESGVVGRTVITRGVFPGDALHHA
jgi:5-formyltetrahydrofolate cyclo-ligase